MKYSSIKATVFREVEATEGKQKFNFWRLWQPDGCHTTMQPLQP